MDFKIPKDMVVSQSESGGTLVSIRDMLIYRITEIPDTRRRKRSYRRFDSDRLNHCHQQPESGFY